MILIDVISIIIDHQNYFAHLISAIFQAFDFHFFQISDKKIARYHELRDNINYETSFNFLIDSGFSAV